MGQQQLLLVILVTIIVGIATVVAINTFGSAADSANVDAVRQDLQQMAAASQSYYMKPSAMGGGSQDFSGIDFTNMGAVACDQTMSGSTAVSGECSNNNGSYSLGTPSGDSFIITATPATADGGSGQIKIDVCANGSKLSDYSPTGSATKPSC